ncbi:DUF6049 family protein [Microbacterium resistens]|uniref:DUF6049 family protein n=1 Tax=Microbacterium resistens TaxID=156977 RepID=A0ABY3RSL0_9MICO|nr:DUF6049 family protein [Microbacterium resistens]UGS25706.1 DUF6049 family protein [Microbacterium resistens]
MTSTPSPTPPRAMPASRVRRATRAVATAVALIVGAAVAVTAPDAAFATPTPTPTPEPAGLGITLVPEAHGTYGPGAPLGATIAIDNADDTALGAGRVRLEIGRTALGDRSAVQSWLSGEDAAAALSPLGEGATTPVDAEETSTVTVVVPAADVGALAPGVYPIRATFSAPAAAADAPSPAPVSAVSVLVVPRGPAPSVAVAVPVTASARGALLNAEELTALTAPDGALSTLLDGVAGTSAILAVDPAIPASIRALGSTAPATATAWLTRLETLPNERFPLRFGDADTAAQASAGLEAPLGVDTLEPLLRPQDFAPTGPGTDATATPTPTPSPTPDPTPTAATPELPDLAELVDVGATRDDLLWPRGEVSAADVATLSRYRTSAAATDDPTVSILPSTSFGQGEAQAPVPARGEVDGAPVLVSDAAVADALSRAAGEADALRRDAPLTEAVALLWFADPASPVLAGLDRADRRSAEGLRDAVTTLSGGRPASLGELLASPAAALTVVSAPAADRAGAVSTLLEDEERVAAFATVLEDPRQLTVRQRISVLRLLAVGRNRGEADFADALAAQRDDTRDTLDAVGLQPSNPILISAAVDVPVWLRNDLPYPVSVRLEAEPSDARLDVQRFTDVTGQPDGTTRLTIPVEARVASGEVDLRMTLTSPTGVPIGDAQVARLTVRAEWENIGLVILGAVAVLLIGGGIVRTVLRRRKAAVASSEDAAEGGTGSDGPDGVPQAEAPENEKDDTEKDDTENNE